MVNITKKKLKKSFTDVIDSNASFVYMIAYKTPAN